MVEDCQMDVTVTELDYLKDFGNEKIREEALKRAVDERKFEIELY